MPDDIRLVLSDLPFDRTLERLRALLAERGITLFAEIDHARNARDAGLAMPSTVVLIFGNASAGTPMMLEAPDIALELPLRILVREEPGGGTVLAYHDPARLARAFGVEAVPAGILALSALVSAAARES
jgi:uncharacterized protein (DUF302 family)